MTRRTTPTQGQVADANAFTRAALGPLEPKLCGKVGVVGDQQYLCRFREGHSGQCYWYLHGAKEVDRG